MAGNGHAIFKPVNGIAKQIRLALALEPALLRTQHV
jgi:hypothetical protein